MLQFLLRARAQSVVTKPDNSEFKARSADRDAATDRMRVETILGTIENVLHETERERLGLSQRVEGVLARAAVTVGNGTDEYLDREPLDNYHQNLLGAELANGQRRLSELVCSIKHFEFLKAVLVDRFPKDA